MKLFRINSVGRALRALVAWPVLAAGLYMAAAVVGSLIPVNADWEPPSQGTAVYIYDNGVHTSLIITRKNGVFDLGDIASTLPIQAPPENNDIDTKPSVLLSAVSSDEFPGDIDEFPYIMIGWGDARFYRETPAWGDVRPGTVLAAFIGSGEQLVHVDRLRHIPYRNVAKLVLRDDEFWLLLDFVMNHFNRKILVTPKIEKGYGPDDRFYRIHPDAPNLSYSALFTCNNWISEALKTAGVKTGAWTPLPFGVMWWHPDAQIKRK